MSPSYVRQGTSANANQSGISGLIQPQLVAANKTTGHTDLYRQMALRYMLDGIYLQQTPAP